MLTDLNSAIARRVVAPCMLGALIALGIVARPLTAQARQPYSVQVAVLGTSIGIGADGDAAGVGIEPQFRISRLLTHETRGTLSLGVGAQYTTHTSGIDRITIGGVFVEPRWLPVVSGRLLPYASGRLGLLRQSNNFGSASSGVAMGAGGGFAVVLTPYVNLDAGAAFVRQKFGDFRLDEDGSTGRFAWFNTYAIKLGLTVGFNR